MTIPILRYENRGSERLRDLSAVTQLISGRSELKLRSVLYQSWNKPLALLELAGPSQDTHFHLELIWKVLLSVPSPLSQHPGSTLPIPKETHRSEMVSSLVFLPASL